MAMRRRGIILVALPLLWLSTGVWGDDYFTFQMQSDPQGIIAAQSGQYPQGSLLQTETANQHSGSYSFGYWSLNGLRYPDSLGQAPNRAAFSLNSNITAIAWYFPTTEDADLDGIFDYLEWHWFGDLSQSPANNPDDDDFIIGTEIDRGYSPVIADQPEDGGTMLRMSGIATYRDEILMKRYEIRSAPQGIVEVEREYIETGTPVTTPTIDYGITDGYYFGYWEVNGVRQADASGAALPSTMLPMTNNTIAIARFFPSSDSDSDGMEDWYEWHWFGNMDLSSTNNPDGDGFTIADELLRGYSPVVSDRPSDGGVLMRMSTITAYRNEAQKKSYQIRSDPQGIVALEQGYMDTGAELATPTIAYGEADGYFFGFWEVNGSRQANTAGVGLPNVVLPMTNDTVAIARFFPAGDSDSDGMEDWYEWHWFGSMDLSSTNNPDGDGFTIAEELVRGYSPATPDYPADGGTMLRLSATTTYRDELLKKNYMIQSDPQGIFNSLNEFVDTGTPIATPTINYGETSGYFFGYWETDGVRQANAHGVALPGIILPMTNDTIAIARFIPAGDEDTDGMEDWYEWYWFGNTALTSTNDPDHDGFSIAYELERGYSPATVDHLADGGIMMRMSGIHSVQFGYFPLMAEGLINGQRSVLFSSNAAIPGRLDFNTNSHPTLGDWDGDGDLDLFVGGSDPSTGSGQVRIFENAGAPQVMNWIEKTTNFAGIAAVWASIANPAPALGDWNSDGLADLAVGGDTNIVWLIASSGSWTGSPPSNIQIAVSSSLAVPAFGDLNSDGWVDLLVLTDTGLVQAYTNTHAPTLPYAATPTLTNLLGTAVPDATGLSTADVNGDGILDILVSDKNGSIWEFHGEATP